MYSYYPPGGIVAWRAWDVKTGRLSGNRLGRCQSRHSRRAGLSAGTQELDFYLRMTLSARSSRKMGVLSVLPPPVCPSMASALITLPSAGFTQVAS